MLFYCAIDEILFQQQRRRAASTYIAFTYVCAFDWIWWLYRLRNRTNKSCWKDWPVGRSKRKSRLRKSERAANGKREKEYLMIFLNIFVNRILQATLFYNYYYFTFYKARCMTKIPVVAYTNSYSIRQIRITRYVRIHIIFYMKHAIGAINTLIFSIQRSSKP